MSNRRQFLKQAGIMTAAAWASPAWAATPAFNYKLGLQLYSLNNDMKQDPKGVLKKVASFGYKEVETYGFNHGNNQFYWGMKPADFKSLLDDNGLTSSSGHYDIDKFLINNVSREERIRYVDDCINGALTLQQDYIVWPWLDPQLRNMEKFKLLAATLNEIGEQVKKAKLQLLYHNHNFEFIEMDGKYGYDVILQETDPALVKMELDLYWAIRSGQDPHKLFSRQPGRFVVWHIKDMDKKDPDLHTVVGDGSIDFKKILPEAKLSGLKHIFVEQGNNYVPDALSCVAKSAGYMKREILK
ncbi:sugar phosphate isomerase/epimerase family protein [Chitinophaga arvensicola]|uniref:Tat (Twin-arginine translocation) pathway signal sequence n=1 Tax=Chitinophaga arvensicola TaxID=29529 RepID=A0A1I0S596_9BACT|nr:sugar phosphate isomerase/epimerase [Chitinophaga arvensicola]SEW50136.1 Tat (twin-arginine translocation) pathway signal sequence [Chitinophaga arvensicola]